MNEPLACRACLATNVKLYDMYKYNLLKVYEDVTGIYVSTYDKYPRYICAFCWALLHKCTSFKEKCNRAQQLLQFTAVYLKVLTTDHVAELNRDTHSLACTYTTESLYNIDKDPAVKCEAGVQVDQKDLGPTSNLFGFNSRQQKLNTYVEEISEKAVTKDECLNAGVHLNYVLPSLKTNPLAVDDGLDDMYSDYPTSPISSQGDDSQIDDPIPHEEAIDVEEVDAMLQQKASNDNCLAIECANEDKNECTIISDTDDSDNESLAKKIKRNKSNKQKQTISDVVEITDEAKAMEQAKLTEREKTEIAKITEETKATDTTKADLNGNDEMKDIEVIILTKEQQIAEIQARKLTNNYINSSYKCKFCYKGFMTEVTYENHIRRHKESSGCRVCEVCGLRWGDERALRSHAASHERRYACRLCGETSSSVVRAKEHLLWHQGYLYHCTQCGQAFSKSTSLLTHVRTRHRTRAICDVCGEPCVSNAGVRLHQKRAHGGLNQKSRMHVCNGCSTAFFKAEALTKHYGDSSEGVPTCDASLSYCKYCGDRFPTETAMDRHIEQHKASDKNVNQCQQCDRSFPNARALTVHSQRAHAARPRARATPAVCETCGALCMSKAALTSHQRIHTGEKPYECGKCNKKFSERQRLQIHIRTHTGERPFKCKECPKAFVNKAALNRHDRTHSGSKPYVCQYCQKGFSQSNSLKVHMRGVHQKMPYRGSKRRAGNGEHVPLSNKGL